MDYSFADFPRELVNKIVDDADTRLYYTLKEMEGIIHIFEWVRGMKEQYPSFCFYPEDFDFGVLFRACKNYDKIYGVQNTCGKKITGFGHVTNQTITIECYLIDMNKSAIYIADLFYSEFYFSNEEDRNKWVINNTEED